MNFVIAKKNRDYLETPVFRAGRDGEEEAVALFTNQALAEAYIADAKWSDSYEVGELQPVELARWLVTAHQQGTEMLVVDPIRSDQLDGERQKVIFLGDPLAAFADVLETEIKKLEPRSTPSELAEEVEEVPDPATPSQVADVIHDGNPTQR